MAKTAVAMHEEAFGVVYDIQDDGVEYCTEIPDWLVQIHLRLCEQNALMERVLEKMGASEKEQP